MKKNIYNDDETFLKWASEIKPVEVPLEVEKMIHKKLKRKLFMYRLKTLLHKKYFKYGLIPITALLCIFLIPSPISASVRSHFYGIFIDDSKMEAYADSEKHTDTPNAPEEINSPESQDIHISDLPVSSSIDSAVVNEDSFDDTVLFSSVSDAETSLKDHMYYLPSLIMGRYSIAVLTQTSSGGWFLKKGETLKLSFNIDEHYASADGTGEHFAFGYVFNHKYYEADYQTDTQFQFQFTAAEDGIYYPAVENMSLSYVKITDGHVETKS